MNNWAILISVLLVAGLVLARNRGWVPRGFAKALAEVVILLSVIVALGLLISPYRDLGR